MRFEGKLEKWNDDRGFGFITPARGGEPVFVHVSAFPRDGRRPPVGEALTFEVEPAGDGKKRAIKVERPGAQPKVRPRVSAGESQARERPRRAARRSLAGVLISTALVVGAGSVAYSQFSSFRAGRVAPPASEVQSADQRESFRAAFRCDGRTHCSQMTSCEEAKFFLRNCPNTQMDGNGDGIPCETQWCTGILGR